MDGLTDGQMDGQFKNYMPPFGGIKMNKILKKLPARSQISQIFTGANVEDCCSQSVPYSGQSVHLDLKLVINLLT